MKTIFLIISILPILTSCGARLVSANSENVVVTNISKTTAGDGKRIAEKQCEKYSKQAFLLNKKSDGTVTYRCINAK